MFRQSSTDFAKLTSTESSDKKLLVCDMAAECDAVAETLLAKLSRPEMKRKGFLRTSAASAVATRYTLTRQEICDLRTSLLELEGRIRQWWLAETQS